MRKIYLFDIGLLVAAVTVAGVLAEEPLYPVKLLKASVSQPGDETALQIDDTNSCACDTQSEIAESCLSEDSIAGQGT